MADHQPEVVSREGCIDTGIWTRYPPKQVAVLRKVGRAVLIRNGVSPEVLDLHKHEVDKWLESRFESLLENILEWTANGKDPMVEMGLKKPPRITVP